MSCHQVFLLQGKALKEIQVILTETSGEHAPWYATIKNWVAQFKHGDFSTCHAPRPGRSKTVLTPEIIYKIHDLILEDSSTKWAPKCLNTDQKHQRCHSSEQLSEFLRHYPNDFLSRLVTMDETWLYHYDPETK